MKKAFIIISLVITLLLAIGAAVLITYMKEDQTPESSSAASNQAKQVPKAANIYIHPNQIAGSLWYKPNGKVVNGHIEGSYSNFALWGSSLQSLKLSKGGFGIYASEIGHTNNSFFKQLTNSGIPLSVETPGFTQCLDGYAIANAELNGVAIPNRTDIDFYKTIFKVDSSSNRVDPHGRGWFVTKDKQKITPKEIVLDHRVLQLAGLFIEADRFAKTTGSWDSRKMQNDRSTCRLYGNISFSKRMSLYMDDYVEYTRTVKKKWPQNTPNVSIHWSVSPWWEWSDEKCLDYNHSKGENYTNSAVLLKLQKPCYNSVQYLNDLIIKMCKDGTCPSTVYFDVDWLYNTQYSIKVLKKHKAALSNIQYNGKTVSINFGINLVDQCGSEKDCVLKVQNGNIVKGKDIKTPENYLQQQSLLNLMQFIKAQGIYDKNTVLRIQSWDTRPEEKGNQINEKTKYSFADTFLQVMKLL